MSSSSDALKKILEDAQGSGCIRLFVAGAQTHVGKTSVCLALLAALRKAGLQPQELAYIKPATQCEAPDLLSKWCESTGVEHVAGKEAPLVFYSGFTRSFLANEQGTAEDWRKRIAAHVDRLAEGRRVVVVDGVGFPSVGSIVGVDNADVALAARAPVLLCCKSGVGAAVDSFNLNCSYFQAKGVPVIGAVFNLGDLEGFNSWENCSENIQKWFALQHAARWNFYGVVPIAPALEGLRGRIAETDADALLALATLNEEHFAQHVDWAGLLQDAAADIWNRRRERKRRRDGDVDVKSASNAPAAREAVMACARKAGARGGS